MSVADQIKAKLTQALQPIALEVIDESAQHAGHVGARPGGESHFNVTIVSEAFSGQNRVTRQRAVYAALAEEMSGPIHALTLTTKTPEEA